MQSRFGIRLLRCVAVVAVTLIGGSALAERAALVATRDATLIEHALGELADGAGPYLRAGRTSQGVASIRRGLLAFDVARRIPSGATITSATLVLRMSATSGPDTPVAVHRVLNPWHEGPSSSSGGQGALATFGDVTWLHRSWPNTYWRVAGGDHARRASAVTTVGGPGYYTWSDSQLTRDVQRWLDAPQSNHGWVLIGAEAVDQTVKRFDAREVPPPDVGPLLVVDYVPPLDEGIDEPAGTGD